MNREKRLLYQKKYYADNYESHKEYSQKYYQEHRDDILAYSKLYYKENRETIKNTMNVKREGTRVGDVGTGYPRQGML